MITFDLCDINSLESIMLIKDIARLQGIVDSLGKGEDFKILFKKIRKVAHEELNSELNELISKKQNDNTN